MNKTKLITIFILLLLTVPLAISSETSTTSCEDEPNTVTIRVAQYPRYAGCDETFELIYNYVWEANGTRYTYTCTELTLEEIKGGGKTPLNTSNFDLLLVGANFDASIKDGLDPKLQENIKQFLLDGGGFTGVCAGPAFASQGFEKSDRLYKKRVNNCVLKIADVYMNSNLEGELQYEFKLGGLLEPNQGLVPLENKVVRNNSNPIFADCPYETLNITYGGGPGMYKSNIDDPNLGEVTPLLIINEELMDTKPIHWFIKGILPGWIPFKRVKTDLKGQYGAIATTYGKGRIVVYTTHPEIPAVINGTIQEYIGRTTGYGFKKPLVRAVYNWTGTTLNMSHNWWIHRRTAAWIAGVSGDELPPCNELMAFVDKPNFRLGIREFYYNGEGLIYGIGNNSVDGTPNEISKPSAEIAKKIVEWAGMTVVAGNIVVLGYAENSNLMEFYINGELQHTDYERPFSWKIQNGNLTGVHSLQVRAYDEYGNYAYDGSNFFFINI